MKRTAKVIALGIVALGSFTLMAAPGKGDPVAQGFVNWQGVTEKKWLSGRHLCPSDLRHKITIIFDLEADDTLQGNFIKLGGLVQRDGISGFHAGDNWETRVLPRNVMFVVSLHGGKDIQERLVAAQKIPKDSKQEVSAAIQAFRSPTVGIYEDLTYEGAPDLTGKRPYVYVMGPTGTEPLFAGTVDGKTVRDVGAAITKAEKKMKADGFKWIPFYGSYEDAKDYPIFAKTLLKGKTAKMAPMKPVEKELLKGVSAKDPEKSKEAQILFDALNQTRSDLLMRIILEARECPHRAVYDAQQLLKFWPAERKQLDIVMARIQKNPEAMKIAQIYCKIMVWADPEFTCKNAGEAKKIVAELNKIKSKDIAKLKESKNIMVQNGALLMDSQLDELISSIPLRVPEK